MAKKQRVRKEASKADKARLAKLPGKRVSKSGKTYYEYRETRTDDSEERKTHGVKTVEGLREKIRPYENKIRSDPKETCFGLDKYGKKAYEKTSGLQSRVYVDDMPKDLPIFTHNHPSGAAFSNADIATAVRQNVGELRVCSKYADYYLRPKVPGWSNRIKNRDTAGRSWANEYEYINRALFQYYNNMASKEYLIRLVKAHTIDGTAEADKIWDDVKHDVNRLHSHEAMERFAKERDLIYKRTLRRGVKLWQPKD